MSTRHPNAPSPRTPSFRRLFGWRWLALFAVFMFWCQGALAQAAPSCDIVLSSPSFPYLYGDPNTGTSFTIGLAEGSPGDCASVNGTIAVDATDSTNGTVASPTTFSMSSGGSTPVSVTLGPMGGGSGVIHVNCTSGCINGTGTFDVYFYTNTTYSMTPRGGSFDLVGNQVRPTTLGVKFEINGSPAVDETIGFYEGSNIVALAAPSAALLNLLGTDNTDSLGRASISHLFQTPGSYTITAGWLCDGLCYSIEMNLVVEPVSMTPIAPASGAQDNPAGTALPLTARFGSASLPALAGTPITWTIVSQPAGGDGSLTGSTNTDSDGLTGTSFHASVPGQYQVEAKSGCSYCANPAYTFTVTVLPASAAGTLSIQSGDGQVRLTNTVADDPLVVRLLDGAAAPVAGQSIAWTVLSGDATITPSSVTDASGDASATLSFGATSGPVVVRASALSGTLSVDFHESSASPNSVVPIGGDAQTGLPGATLPQPLTVKVIPPSGVTAVGGGSSKPNSLSGIPVTWTVTSGGGSVSSSTSYTDANGEASVQYTLGATPGTNTVEASVAGASPAVFTVTTAAAASGQLNIVSGNNQTLAPGIDSAPLLVELKDALGNPLAGVTVHWNGTGASVSSASSVTDANGRTSITAVVNAIGAASVSASTDSPAAGPVTFTLNGGLSSLPGLTEQGSAIAGALDRACPALAALSQRTAGEQDLYEICQELALVDPQSAIDAISEMFPDFSLALADASLVAMQAQFQNLKTRIAALRAGTQGNSFGGLAIYSPLGNIPVASLIGAFAGQDDGGNQEVGAGFDRWGYFVSGTIGRGKAQAGTVNPAYDFDINGLTAGVDYRKSDKLIFGGAVGYTKQSTDLRGQIGKLDTKGWSVSGYSTFYKESSWYSDVVLTYGHNTYDTARRVHFTLVTPTGTNVIDQVARSSSSGAMFEGALTVGHDFQKNGWSISPYGRALYTRLNFGSTSEHLDLGSGLGLGLQIDARDVSSLSSQIGAKFAFAHSADWGILMPHLQVEWEHEFRDDPQSLTARFLNDPTATPIHVQGDRQDSDFFRMGVGLSMVMTHGRSGFVLYERVVARQGYSQDSLALGFRIEF